MPICTTVQSLALSKSNLTVIKSKHLNSSSITDTFINLCIFNAFSFSFPVLFFIHKVTLKCLKASTQCKCCSLPSLKGTLLNPDPSIGCQQDAQPMSAGTWLTGCSSKKKLLSESRKFDLSGANNLSALKQRHMTSIGIHNPLQTLLLRA